MAGNIGINNQDFSIFQSQSTAVKDETGKVQNGSKSISAAGLQDRLNPIDEKINAARRKAMGFVRDALAGELSIDESQKKRNDHIGELGRTINESEKAIDDIDDEIGALREKFGIEPGGKEDKEIEFMIRAEKAREDSINGRIPEEMQERYDKLIANETEYQGRAKRLFREREVYADALDESKKAIRVENAIVRDTDIERLKTDPMGDAWEQADAVMEAAGKDAMGMLVDEAVSNIDEDLEKEKDKAEKAAEEKEKLEERIDAARAKEKEQEELTEEILEAAGRQSIKSLDMSNPDSEINELMSKLKLIEYDVKGSVVDEEV